MARIRNTPVTPASRKAAHQSSSRGSSSRSNSQDTSSHDSSVTKVQQSAQPSAKRMPVRVPKTPQKMTSSANKKRSEEPTTPPEDPGPPWSSGGKGSQHDEVAFLIHQGDFPSVIYRGYRYELLVERKIGEFDYYCKYRDPGHRHLPAGGCPALAIVRMAMAPGQRDAVEVVVRHTHPARRRRLGRAVGKGQGRTTKELDDEDGDDDSLPSSGSDEDVLVDNGEDEPEEAVEEEVQVKRSATRNAIRKREPGLPKKPLTKKPARLPAVSMGGLVQGGDGVKAAVREKKLPIAKKSPRAEPSEQGYMISIR